MENADGLQPIVYFGQECDGGLLEDRIVEASTILGLPDPEFFIDGGVSGDLFEVNGEVLWAGGVSPEDIDNLLTELQSGPEWVVGIFDGPDLLSCSAPFEFPTFP